ncbi:hypothetical protein [Actinoplanes utahensis]|uniref:Uncharacterized protein n=1 Tax=Actinoplanes utahensis TaxID=1869 RepID=A0A0A6UH71_ACTUT|nr:hypothetical protein [Actinoplanes utahensis]KHD75380.1 hypothetical protein MB27_23400 [Actinoplanes utahensis]GIF33708.1 hypothetical protein Aut01nite_66940 [Actinoplanes utahensis]
MFLAPAIVGVGLVAGAGFLAARGVGVLAGAAGDRMAARQTRGWAVADRIARIVADHRLLQDQIQRGQAQFGALISAGPALGEVPGTALDLGRGEQWAGQAEAMLAAAESRFRTEMAAARTRWVMNEVAAALDRLPKPAPVPGRPRAAAAAPAPSARVAESLQRVLGRMDGGVPPGQAKVLQKRAADALTAATETARLRLLDDLRYSVDQANEQVRRRQSTLRELAARLAGYTGPAVDGALAAISAAGADPDPDLPGLSSLVEAAVAATLAPMVRDYTRQALRESLEEIGCTVEEEFDTALGVNGLAHLRRDGWEDLAVRVRSRGEENAYYFNMVAPAGAVADDVAAIEHQWCSAVDKLLPALEAHGLQVTTTHRSEEGDPHVQNVDPARFPFERRRRDDRRRDQDQRRERKLPR